MFSVFLLLTLSNILNAIKIVTLVVVRQDDPTFSNKTTLFGTIAIDNRVRYCSAQPENVTCSLYNHKQVAEHPKRLKLETISYEVFLSMTAENPSPILWLDADALIIRPISEMSRVCADGYDVGLANDLAKSMGRTQLNSGVVLFCPTERAVQLINRAVQRMSQLAKVSDQRVLNRLIGKNVVANLKLKVMPRELYNAFPQVNSHSWIIMKQPKGDEDDLTKIVHFAGQFSGEDIETGKITDFELLLKSLQEFLTRHMMFLCGLSYTDNPISFKVVNAPLLSCTATSNSQAIKIVQDASDTIRLCLRLVSEVFDDIERSERSRSCLTKAKNTIEKLWYCYT